MIKNSIKKNSLLNGVKTISLIIFPLITFSYGSRVLQPENIGKINFGLSIVSYFTLIASLGIATYAIRECSRVRNDKKELSNMASQIFSINILTTVLAYAALAVTLLVYRKLDGYRAVIGIQSLTILASTLGADWLNSAMEDYKALTVRTIAFQVLGLLLMFAFVHGPEDYLKYATISLVTSAGTNVMNIWYRKRYCDVCFLRNVRSIEWKRHMIPIVYLFVMMLAQTIFNSVDSTMLGLIKGDREVGIYSAAHKVVNIASQLVASLLWVVMPRLSYYFSARNYDEINKLLRKVLGFNLTLGLPIAAGGIVISDDIITVVSGNEFSDASIVLKILLIGFVFALIGGNFLGNTVLLPSKQEKYYMIICCITAVINIIGNYFFIPKFGACAAAGTTAVCCLVIMALLLFKVDRKIRLGRIWPFFVKPLIGCCSIVAICLLCKQIGNIWLRTIASLVASAGLYFVIEVWMKNEIVLEGLYLLKKKTERP